MPTNGFDSALLQYTASLVCCECEFDLFVLMVSNSVLLKGAVPVTILWYLGFKGSDSLSGVQSRVRVGVVTALIANIVAIGTGRLLTSFLPFRPRPIHNGEIGYPTACGLNPSDMNSLSSFPSDHAVMFFALAMGIFMISRRWGVVAFLHATLLVLLPRMILGLHYPTDLLAGALLGMVVTLLFFITPITRVIAAVERRFYQINNGLYYAALWLLSLETAMMFKSLVDICQYATYFCKS